MAWRPLLSGLAVAGLLLGAAGARAETTEVRFAVTPEFAGGRAGAEARGAATAVPFATTIAADRLALTLRIPDLPGAGAEGGAAATGGRVGDMRLTARLSLAEGEPTASPWLDLAVQTRVPTASDPSLGSGQFEHVVRLDSGMELPGGLSVDLSAGRRLAPFGRQGRAGQDYWVGQGSVALAFAEKWSAGIAAYAQDRQPDIATPIVEVGGFLEREVAPDLAIGLFTWHGLTRESPAFTIGLRLAYRVRWSPARLGE